MEEVSCSWINKCQNKGELCKKCTMNANAGIRNYLKLGKNTTRFLGKIKIWKTNSG